MAGDQLQVSLDHRDRKNYRLHRINAVHRPYPYLASIRNFRAAFKAAV